MIGDAALTCAFVIASKMLRIQVFPILRNLKAKVPRWLSDELD